MQAEHEGEEVMTEYSLLGKNIPTISVESNVF